MEDKNKVLIALNLTQSTAQTACPTNEEIAALLDNRVDRHEKNRLFEHLNSCSKCYQHWLEISSNKNSGISDSRFGKKFFKISGFAAAIAVCVVLIMVTTLMRQPEMAKMIDSSYQTAFKNGLPLQGLGQDRIPALSWELETKRSLPYKPESSASKAFIFGFISGREELGSTAKKKNLSSAEWRNTEWAPCFFLGRWCVLLESVCNSDQNVPISFWKQQDKILGRMDSLLLEQHTLDEMFELEIVGKALRQIKAHLKAELSKTYDPKSTCRVLEPELEAIKASLS